MLRWRLAIILSIILLAAISLTVVLWRRPAPVDPTVDLATQQAAERTAFLSSTDRLVLFLGIGDDTPVLYGNNTVTQTTLPLDTNLPAIYSNYLPASQHWYTVTDQTLQRNGEVITTLTQPAVLASATSTQASLAVDAAEQVIAWVGRTDHTETIRLLQLTSLQETVLYQGEPNVHYANLTWSPDGSELAFTADSNKIITVTLDGAETYAPIGLPFHEFTSVAWLTLDQFGIVASSQANNPEPFPPKVLVVKRSGQVLEEHTVFEKIGVPRVIWSADGSQFMFYHPWQNSFMIYNRYDQLIQSVSVAAPGKLVPFGYAAGTGPVNPDPAELDSTLTNPTLTDSTFEVSAEDWEHYNRTVRGILEQWSIDLSSYRFIANDTGLSIAFQYEPTAQQDPLELVVIQTILQTFFNLPEVPAITMTVGSLTLDNVSASTATASVQSLLHKSLDQLFVVNQHYPLGKRTPKADQSKYHYIGDLVYSRYGDYNPHPMLALLGATPYYTTDTYTFKYPATFNVRTIDDRTVLLYTGTTNFLSPSAWSEFGLTVRTYDAPGVTLDQWLSVQRPDQVAEVPAFTPYQPLETKHIITNTTYSDEYVALADNLAYVFTIQRDDGLTADDRMLLQTLTQSFSVFYALQRN